MPSPYAAVLCAIDHSELAPRVLRHAAGFAGIAGVPLSIVSIAAGQHRDHTAIDALVRQLLPAGAPYLAPPEVHVLRVTQGTAADAILEMTGPDTGLLVMGTRARTGIPRWLLGSTSASVLERTTCPTLLVAPGDVDIVSLTPDAVRLNVGAVLAAVDLFEPNPAQVEMASALARRSGQPLVLMTVAGSTMSDTDAEAALRQHSEGLHTPPVDHVVVRRGAIAQEIARVAAAEPAGLVVMGLRGPGHGTPGEIASEVLRTRDAVVLAVPAH